MRFAHGSKDKLKLIKENDEVSNKGLSREDKKQSKLLKEEERDHSSITATINQVF